MYNYFSQILFTFHNYMNINKLKKDILTKNISQRKVADMLGLQLGSYQHFLKSDDCSVSTLEKICKAFDFDISNYIGGSGGALNEVTALAPIGVGGVNVIELSQPALASFFVNMEEDMRIARQVYMPGLPERDAPYYAMEVSGDSMYPHLRQGDWLYAERLEGAPPPIKPQTLYAVAIGGNMLAKWLRIHPETDTIELISANPLYPSMHEPLSEVRAILRVVAVLKTV